MSSSRKIAALSVVQGYLHDEAQSHRIQERAGRQAYKDGGWSDKSVKKEYHRQQGKAQTLERERDNLYRAIRR